MSIASTCSRLGCENPKVPGRGARYCADCRVNAETEQRTAAVIRTREWRAAHPEQYRETSRAHYERTAEEQRERARRWYYGNPDRVAENRIRQRAKRRPRVGRYGLTIAEYRALLAAQNGKCAICGRTENGKRHNFDVDHDHRTGAIRGLLCNRCNRLLSNALDSVELLQRAAEYLATKEA